MEGGGVLFGDFLQLGQSDKGPFHGDRSFINIVFCRKRKAGIVYPETAEKSRRGDRKTNCALCQKHKAQSAKRDKK
jgi:hypothetical protein